MVDFTQDDIRVLNDWAGYLSLKPNFIARALSICKAKTIFVDTGNQAGKTANIVYDYVLRILGFHPIEEKNIRPNTPIRIFRFASERLPTESEEGGEIANTVYPQLKKFLPYEFIKKDITARRPAVTVRDRQGGKDIVVEFVSYNQEVQTQAGHQRASVYEDEEAPKSFHEEQIPRLLASNGDHIIGCTPVEQITWMYEDIFQKAGIFYNSPFIRQYMEKSHGQKMKSIEETMGDKNVAVIRAATDDNPTLNPKAIEEKSSRYDDVSTMEVRRYGIFHQISGVTYKGYDSRVHFREFLECFPNGIPHEWIHGRGVDYHEHTNWACLWMALSPQNEAFVYNEYNPSPDYFISLTIAKEIAERSKDYKFMTDRIDPRAEIKQANTGRTVVEDLNRYFTEFRRDGLGTGANWRSWDTKNMIGYEIVKERLANSRLVGSPFCNMVKSRDGGISYLPTLWILNTCPTTDHYFKNWRWEPWANREATLTKEEKNKREDKYSHFPITVECLFKDSVFNVYNFMGPVLQQRENPYNRYMRARA